MTSAVVTAVISAAAAAAATAVGLTDAVVRISQTCDRIEGRWLVLGQGTMVFVDAAGTERAGKDKSEGEV